MKTQSANLRAAERGQETRPIFFYHFDYEGTHYYFTNYDQDSIVSGGPAGKMANPQTFTAAQVEHSRPDQTMELNASQVVVGLGAIDTELRKYFLTAPTKQIDVDIWRANSSLAPGPIAYGDLFMEFRGIVDSIGFDDYVIRAACVSLLLREDRLIPAVNYQRTCNHKLYGTIPGGCGVIKALFATTVSIAAIDRVQRWVQINVTNVNVGNPVRNIVLTPDYFEGGFLEDVNGNEVAIVSSALVPGVGVKLYLQWWPHTLAAAQNITAYPGCNRTTKHCHERFQNLHRILATPHVPNNNPAIDGILV